METIVNGVIQPSSVPQSASPPALVTGSRTITLVREKECKGSVRYKNMEQDPIIDTIYLSRKAFPLMPKQIQVTIGAVV